MKPFCMIHCTIQLIKSGSIQWILVMHIFYSKFTKKLTSHPSNIHTSLLLKHTMTDGRINKHLGIQWMAFHASNLCLLMAHEWKIIRLVKHFVCIVINTKIINSVNYWWQITSGALFLFVRVQIKEPHNFFTGCDKICDIISTGNHLLHLLTTRQPYEMKVDLGSFMGEQAFARYATFSVESEAEKFALHIGTYSGNASE